MTRIGVWSSGLRKPVDVVMRDGVLCLEPTTLWQNEVEFKRSFGRRFFGDSEFLVGTAREFTDRILRECEGKTESEIEIVVGRYVKVREEFRSRERREREKWGDLFGRFDGLVIGLDKDIDVFDTGFSVRVLFKGGSTFGERSEFLKCRSKDFLRWVIEEIADSKRISKRIGDIRYYRPVEITNLRVCEVEVKFEGGI